MLLEQEFDTLIKTKREPADAPPAPYSKKRRRQTQGGGRCAELLTGGVPAACTILCGAVSPCNLVHLACPGSAAVKLIEKRALS